MKARVRATGKIVFIEANLGYPGGYVASDGKTYLGEELEVIVDCDPDYWTRLEHQYAGMAMQGILTNPIGFENIRARGTNIQIETALLASEFAHALIQKLKEKEERK